MGFIIGFSIGASHKTSKKDGEDGRLSSKHGSGHSHNHNRNHNKHSGGSNSNNNNNKMEHENNELLFDHTFAPQISARNIRRSLK